MKANPYSPVALLGPRCAARLRAARVRRGYAFTLIELLIVVAIIAILAAIAVPNFLEAQTRSKVSRVRADQRSLATAIESYRIDNNKYPIDCVSLLLGYHNYGSNRAAWPHSRVNNDYGVRWSLVCLSTPIAYVTSLPLSPFDVQGADMGSVGKSSIFTPGLNPGSEYATSAYNPARKYGWFNDPAAGFSLERVWRLRDGGPDRWLNNAAADAVLYDPTNGTVSKGDIVHWGP